MDTSEGIDRAWETDAQEATQLLRVQALQIAKNPNFEGRKQRAIELIGTMDTTALHLVSRRLGLSMDVKNFKTFIIDSCVDTMSLFHPEMTAEQSATARSGSKQPNVTRRILAYWKEELGSDFSNEKLQTEVNVIEEEKGAYLGAIVDFFEGDPHKLAELANENPKRIELLLAIIFGAHARWAVGQIERSLNEKSSINPLERPIFGDLRRVYDAKKEELEKKGDPTPDEKVREDAISSLGQDWDAARERITAELENEIKDFQQEHG